MQIAAGTCKIGFVNQSFIVKVHEAYRLLLTYDREIIKIPDEILREINARVSGE